MCIARSITNRRCDCILTLAQCRRHRRDKELDPATEQWAEVDDREGSNHTEGRKRRQGV